jgi:hypothetical protein
MNKLIVMITATLCGVLLAGAGPGGCSAGDRRAALLDAARSRAAKSIVPATAMPDLGVCDAQARGRAACLFGRSG